MENEVNNRLKNHGEAQKFEVLYLLLSKKIKYIY